MSEDFNNSQIRILIGLGLLLELVYALIENKIFFTYHYLFGGWYDKAVEPGFYWFFIAFDILVIIYLFYPEIFNKEP